jgi:integrase
MRYVDKYKKRQNLKLGRADDITLTQARKLCDEKRNQVAMGIDPRDERKALHNMPTLYEFYTNQVLPYAMQSKKSWKHEQGLYTKHILPALGRLHLDEIMPKHIESLTLDMKNKRYANGTINIILRFLKSTFNLAINRWEIQGLFKNPANKIKELATVKRSRYLSEDELVRLKGALEQSKSTMKTPIVLMLLATGARKRELLDSKWSDFDTDRQEWLIPMSKSGKPRVVALNDTALKILHKVKALHISSTYAFPNTETKKPFKNISYQWMWIRNKADLPDLRIHDLRHSFASFLINGGRSLYEVQNLLGHSSSRMTERYAHLDSKTTLSAARAADAMLGSLLEGNSIHSHVDRLSDSTRKEEVHATYSIAV